jgi:peptidoglycan/LPS O-acetylase OafA/YrhL
LLSVQRLRAAAALLVALYHLATTAPFGRLGPGDRLGPLATFFEAVGFAGVDLFFVISGAVMMVTCWEQFGHAGASGRFLLRRAIRIHPLYWLATLAVLAACWVRPEWMARDKLSAAFVAKSLALWPQREFPVVAVGWTLTYEMFFYVAFAALLLLPRRAAWRLLAAWAVATLVLYTVMDDPADHRKLHGYLQLPVYASPLVLEFLLGCCIGAAVRTRTVRWAGAALAAGIVALGVVGTYVGAAFTWESQYGLTRLVVYGLPSALIVYGAVSFEVVRGTSPRRWLDFWGDASYSTYLTHVYVILLFSRIATTRLAEAPIWLVWLAAAGCLICCGLVAAACYVLVERPMHRRLAHAVASGTSRAGSAGRAFSGAAD